MGCMERRTQGESDVVQIQSYVTIQKTGALHIVCDKKKICAGTSVASSFCPIL